MLHCVSSPVYGILLSDMAVSHQKKKKKKEKKTGWELLLYVLGLCSAQEGTCSHHGGTVIAAAQPREKSLCSSNRETGVLVLKGLEPAASQLCNIYV